MISTISTQVATTVGRYLGSGLDNSDADAVELGADLALTYLQGMATMFFGAKPERVRERVISELKELARARVDETDPVFHDRDFTRNDARYPASSIWENQDGTDDATGVSEV